MEVRSIKNVDSSTWKKFKSLANKEGVTMSALLRSMIKNYEKKKSDLWGIVFENSGKLTKNEGEKLEKDCKNLRKEKGFRV